MGDYTIDKSFTDKVLLPGFVEAHCHAMNGSVWENTYVGYFDRTDPDGRVGRFEVLGQPIMDHTKHDSVE